MKRSRPLFSITLVLVDALMSLLGFYLAYRLSLITIGPKLGRLSSYLALGGALLVSNITVFFLYKFYHRRSAHTVIDEFYRLSGAVSIATLLSVAFISFAVRDTLEYQRSMVAYSWGISLVTITVGRFVHRRWQYWMQRRGVGLVRVLIIGTGEVGRMILQKIQHTPYLGYQVVGFVEANEANPTRVLNIPVLGCVNDLPQIVEAQGVQEVLIGLPEASHEELVGIVSYCEREKVTIRVLPDIFQIMASEVTIDDLGGLPMLTVRDVALRGWKLTLKRIVDVVFASIGLVLLSPVMMLTALIVKLDSRGPAFFVQERMGMDAKPFPMIKFRSMRQDAENHGTWTTKDDPRRTRFGAFIRRTSIDELPQFINVLIGDMSLVGPRPEQPTYVEQFRQRIPQYMDRHREKAGCTGWAQVNGLRGDTSIAERTKYDLWYIENWSLWLDFKILILTVLRAFTDRNAY